ncbi:unnamed protein product [Arabidopsis halleri]
MFYFDYYIIALKQRYDKKSLSGKLKSLISSILRNSFSLKRYISHIQILLVSPSITKATKKKEKKKNPHTKT